MNQCRVAMARTVDWFDGKKTFFAASGLICLGIYQCINEHDFNKGFHNIFEGLMGICGRVALQKASGI